MIKVDLCRVYKNKDFYLDISNINFKEGHSYFIIGSSGSGKTTFIKTILGLEKSKKEVDIYRVIDNVSYKLENKKYKEGLIYFSQELNLWEHLSVVEHINFTITAGKSIKDIDESFYYLELVNLKDKAKIKPKYLSQGEKQRLALARALSAKPKFLFLDEPFANIDIVQANRFMYIIKDEQKRNNFSLVKVTHNFIGIDNLDNIIIVLENGKVTFKGSYKDMIKDNQTEWIEEWKRLMQ